MNKSLFKIYYTGSEEQAEYVKNYSLLNEEKVSIIGLTNQDTSGSNVEKVPASLKKMFFLDLPDLIITYGDKDNLVMGIEITEQVPFGYNMTQRFARTVASAIEGIPFAFILPQRKYDYYPSSDTGSWRYEWRLFKALQRATEIHKVPILPFLWPVDERKFRQNGGLIYNRDPEFSFKHVPPSPSENSEMKDFFNFVDKTLRKEELIRTPELMERSKKMGEICNFKYIDPEKLAILDLIKTSNLEKYLKQNTDLNRNEIIDFMNSEYYDKYISKRKDTLFFRPTADPLLGSRGYGDPYAGTSLAFDYILCRYSNGTSPVNRDINLVNFFDHDNAWSFWSKLLGDNRELISKIMPFGNLKGEPFHDEYLLSNSYLKLRKEVRIFFYVSDIILLRNKILY